MSGLGGANCRVLGGEAVRELIGQVISSGVLVGVGLAQNSDQNTVGQSGVGSRG